MSLNQRKAVTHCVRNYKIDLRTLEYDGRQDYVLLSDV